MRRTPAFWDSSALVPLCVRQRISPAAIALYKVHDAVVWWTTAVEIASALARLARMKEITAADYGKARKLARDLAHSWSMILPSDAVRDRAVQLVERCELRAADALQLAAALAWCEDAPQGEPFLTADHKLREAAEMVGFECKAI